MDSMFQAGFRISSPSGFGGISAPAGKEKPPRITAGSLD